jgi:hypothetical protein
MSLIEHVPVCNIPRLIRQCGQITIPFGIEHLDILTRYSARGNADKLLSMPLARGQTTCEDIKVFGSEWKEILHRFDIAPTNISSVFRCRVCV